MSGETERFEPRTSRGRIAYEHFHRYSICREFVRDLDVLDIACGTGYGSALLSEVAKSVTGIDLSEDAISNAADSYKKDNLKYTVANCYALPFDSASFDAVVANEMIEHVQDHDGLLEEAKRVLRPNGIVLISTPNKPIYNRYKPPNVFHVSEMNQREFSELIERHFQHHHLLGLRLSLNSISYPLNTRLKDEAPTARIFRGEYDARGDMRLVNEELALPDPEYFLALCSDSDLPMNEAESSLYLAADDDLWSEHEKILAWASQLHEEDEVLRAALSNAQSALNSHANDTAAAVEAVRRENVAEMATFRERERIINLLIGRIVGKEQARELQSPIEGLVLASEKVARLEAKVDEIERLKHDVDEGHLAIQRLSDDLRGQVARADELRAQRDAQSQRVITLEADIRNRATEIEELKQQQIERTKLAEQLTAIQREGSRSREAHRAAMTSERKRAIQAEIQRDEAQAANRALEQQRNQATNAARASRRAVELYVSKLNFARAHGRIAKEIEAASSHVRLTLAEQPVPSNYWETWKLWKGRKPESFMAAWMVSQQPEIKGNIVWRRYLHDRSLFELDPHPLFSASYYFSQLPPVKGKIYNPLLHYLTVGWRQGLSPHQLFPNDWYLAQNPDVLAHNMNPLEHYLAHGWRENRAPNPVFDGQDYLIRYPDVARDNMNPLVHYLAHGRSEGREISSRQMNLQALHLLPASARSKGMMHFLLTERVAEVPLIDNSSDLAIVSGPDSETSWPPKPLDDYWLPQIMRNYVLNRFGEHLTPLLTYLFSVMKRYSEPGQDFPGSVECMQLFERAKFLANQQRRSSGNATKLEASIVIPVYNNLLDTMLCIVSVLELNDLTTFEIIVADDCSTDATPQVVSGIGGCVRHVRHAGNKGFLQNCNVAAGQAYGETIVLLNNDTIVMPGWLDGLLAPFCVDENIGLVGSKLLNGDGSLQEAGGIFWRDGSAWNFGRNQNPSEPQFNYLKDVDYCSGASIAIPTILWRELGGFDPAYEPAYSEDADLAFRIRERGLRTIYNPASEVIHHEGRSHGRDTSSGIKAYQVVNQAKFRSQWAETLQRDHFENAQNLLRARDRSFHKPHILVVDHYVPQWDQDAGSRTMYQFLCALLDAGFSITFWPDNLHKDPHYTARLQAMGIEVIYGPLFVNHFAEFLSDRSGLYDAVLLSRPHIASKFISDVRTKSNAVLLYYGHDLHFERMRAAQGLTDVSQDDIEKMRDLEVAVCNGCDVVFYPSQEEVSIVRSLVDDRVVTHVMPAYSFERDLLNDSRVSLASISQRSNTVLFVGGFAHHPNVDGLFWFCKEIAPLLRAAGVSFFLKVVGSRAKEEIFALQCSDIEVLGFVSDEDLGDLYREAALAVAPLRYGAGVKGKVIEAMANGVPVVTTTVGAQGIPDAEQYLHQADSAADFAAAVANTLDDREAAIKRANRAIDLVEATYSGVGIIRTFREALPALFKD